MGGRCAAAACKEVMVELLCGEHAQFEQWLQLLERAVGSPQDECGGSLRRRVLEVGPPMHLSSDALLPLPPGPNLRLHPSSSELQDTSASNPCLSRRHLIRANS